LLPVFTGSTGVGGTLAEDETGEAIAAPRSTTVTSLRVQKNEPSAESELVRGVHRQTTIYELEVTAAQSGAVENVTVVDFIPAGLEYLACRDVDNSTYDWTGLYPGDAREYPGAPRLDAEVSDDILFDCPDPVSVDTRAATLADATTYGVTEGLVYTVVTWEIPSVTSLTPYTIRYGAGVP